MQLADLSQNTPDRLVYLIQGNKAFTRLLSVVLKDIQGLEHQIVPGPDLAAAVRRRRPNLIVLLEDSRLYGEIRADRELADIPILLVCVNEPDAGGLIQLTGLDRTWVLKNNSAELLGVLDSMSPSHSVKRILCVDDSRTVLNELKRAFAGTPYVMHTAGNGQEALDMLDAVDPDLLLVDVEMPVIDGLTFCREVRSREGHRDLPLIILSSRVDYDTIAEGFEAGADEYLTKPFFADELLNKVESYLRPRPARRKEQILVLSSMGNTNRQLRLALEHQGFEVTATTSPNEALEAAASTVPDLIIADTVLEGITGFQFCTNIRSLPETKRIPFIILTAKTSSGARKMGRKVGVTAYLTKPFTREGAVALIERILAEHRSLKALEWDMALASITSLAKALDERDSYTCYHSENVSKFAVAIGRRAGLDTSVVENLRLAGLLHDIGKIGIPDVVLHKPGKLTDEEFDMIREHSRVGAEILGPIPGLEEVVACILHHHERVDGQGYPDGLRQDEIPIMSQIMAVADTYDALVTDRPYRQGMSREKAVAIMKEVSGTQLSSRYVRLFLDWLKESGGGGPA